MMVGLMQGWNLWKRFALFAVLGAALVAAPLAMYVRESSSAIAAAQAEQRGIEPTKKLLGVIRLAQQHRGLSANVLTGTSNMDAQRRAKRAELDAAIKAFGATVGELGSGTIARGWADSVRTWDALAQAVDSNSLSASESFGRHTSLIDRYLVLVESIADHSGLALDSQADSYNLMRATVIDLPYVTEALGQARARGAAYLAKKQASAVERASLASLTAIAATHQRTMYRAFDKATAGGAELKTKLDGMLKASADEVNRAFKLATQEVVEAEKLAMPSADYFKVFTEAIDAQFKLNSLGLDELDKLLSQRVSDLRSGQLLVLGVIAAVVLLSLWVGTAVTRSVLGQMGGEPKEAMDVAARVAAGDLAEEIALRPGDRNSLMAAMASMQSVLRQFVSAQERIKQEHDAGMIDYRIDATRFQGSFRDMAQLANELVASHIAVQTRIVEVVKSYAAGDLAPDMDRLPGAKARITEAIDGVKAGLKSVNAQIQMLAQAASRGDFSVRGDEAKFSDEFRAMVSALNRLMDVANVGLSDVSRMLGAMARGDLTQRITAPYEGTFDRLKQDANRTAESLAAIVAGIRETTDAITTATKEIAQGNADLSGRTEAQASSLEETASSMEELTSTVKQNAQNARQANQLAISACDVAVKGGDVVNQVVTTMGSINESSAKIVDIIAVIDGIAFQTNILALNAAVEAARAGEQGRGFAVVATEVRNLAQRSAAAAKEIKTLISNSVEKVDFGSKLVDRAGETMAQVVASIKRVTDIVAEITVASQEQSSGIEQVNQAVTQMDESTQQNAALVEEAAAAAESLQEQANALTSAVARFQVKSGRPDASSSGSAAQQGRSTQAPNVTRVPAAGGRSVVPALAT